MMRNTLVFFRTFTLPLLLTAGALCAQNNAFRQPLPSFKYKADNGMDTARQYQAAPVEALVTGSHGVNLPENRTVEKWTKSSIFVTPKTERDEKVKTFGQREG